MKGIGILALGWFLVGLGIVGLFLPFLQGVLFIMIGLAILSSRNTTVKRLLGLLEKHYPDQYQGIEALKGKVTGWFRKS